MKTQIVILGLAGAFLILNSPVLAIERLVPSQYSTIQAAIDDCNNGDVVIVEPNIYTGPGNRDIDFKGLAITVRSTDPNDPYVVAATVIDCEGSPSSKHRGFRFHSGEGPNSIVAGFTIINGDAPEEQIGGLPRDVGGAVACDGASPTIRHCIISNNYARRNGYGGGICCWNGSSAKMEYCTITNNYAHNSGGGILSYNSSPIIRNCIIKENTTGSSDGGGMWCMSGGAVSIHHCVIEGNVAEAFGGGIGIADISGGTIDNCIILDNSAGTFNFGGSGGGIFGRDSTATVSNCTIVGNSANGWDPEIPIGYGGGLYSEDSSVLVRDCIFWDNTADNDGQQIYGGSISVAYSDVQDGYAGTGNIHDDPCFVTGPLGDYYLSQIAAGQDSNSPCVDAGSDTAANLGMDIFTTRTDEVLDAGIVDMGYHYSAPIAADINRDLKVDLKDLAILGSQWRQEPGIPSADIAPPGGDGRVDEKDLAVLVDTCLWEKQ